MRLGRSVSPEDLGATLSLLYDAALGSLPWQTVLPQVTRFLGADRGGLAIRTRGPTGQFVLTHNLDPGLLERWAGEFSRYDPWLERFACSKRPGELLHGASESFFAEVREMEVYERFLGPLGADDLLATRVTGPGEAFGYVGAYRSRAEGTFDDTDLARARLLAPHLVRAARIQGRLGDLGEEAAAAELVLGLVPYGVLVLDADQTLLWANRRAEHVLRESAALVLRGGAVHARDARRDARLAAACAAAARIGGANGEGTPTPSLWTMRDERGRRTELLVVPVGLHAGQTTLSFAQRRARVVLLLAQPEAPFRLSPEAVGRALDLPPALARLAAAIGSGQTIAQHAVAAGVRPGTARQQLKELLGRSGVHRQAELVALLQRSLAALYGLPLG